MPIELEGMIAFPVNVYRKDWLVIADCALAEGIPPVLGTGLSEEDALYNAKIDLWLYKDALEERGELEDLLASGGFRHVRGSNTPEQNLFLNAIPEYATHIISIPLSEHFDENAYPPLPLINITTRQYVNPPSY